MSEWNALMPRYPRLLDGNLQEITRLNPSAISATLCLNPISTASMNLPDGEPTVSVRQFVELYGPMGSLGIYRVASVATAYGNEQRVSLEHGITTLEDDLTAANTELTGSMRDILQAIINSQGEDPAGELADSVANAAKVIMKNVGEMVPRLATGAVQVLQKLGPMINEWLGTVDFKELGSKLGEGLKTFIANLPATLASIKEALSTGWAEIVWPTIQGLFSAAFGVDMPDWNTLVENISTGWNETVWPGIQGFFKETFNIDLPSWEDTVAKITAWWDKVKESVGGFWSAVFSIFTEDEDGLTTSERLKKWWDKVAEAYGNYFSALFGIELPSAEKIKADIETWWAGIKKNLALSLGINLTTPKAPAKIPSVNDTTFDEGFPTITQLPRKKNLMPSKRAHGHLFFVRLDTTQKALTMCLTTTI